MGLFEVGDLGNWRLIKLISRLLHFSFDEFPASCLDFCLDLVSSWLRLIASKDVFLEFIDFHSFLFFVTYFLFLFLFLLLLLLLLILLLRTSSSSNLEE